MNEIKIVNHDHKSILSNLFSLTNKELFITTPFITKSGSNFLLSNLKDSFKRNGSLTIITNLSPNRISNGATDPSAILNISNEFKNIKIYHLLNLHAKIYVSDKKRAIITSANLTEGGVNRNYEYGTDILFPEIVNKIYLDMINLTEVATYIELHQFKEFCDFSKELVSADQKQIKSVDKELTDKLNNLLSSVEDKLIYLKLKQDTIHGTFEKTVYYILRAFGPLSTAEIHPLVEQIHPDLCDNTVDRIIDGQRFGKKWKHAVRTSQQKLRQKGLIKLKDGKWEILK